MKWIKTFENWDNSSEFQEFYECDDCHHVYSSVNPKFTFCRTCKSKNVKPITEEEYYSIVINQSTDSDEIGDILRNKEEMNIGHIDPNSLTHPGIHPYPSIPFDIAHINKIDQS